MKTKVKPAPKYGELVYTTVTGITNINRIRLHDHCSDNWNTQLIHNNRLYYRTDQDERWHQEGAKYCQESNIFNYDKVYFNGVLIYNRSLYRKMIDFLQFHKRYEWKL